MLVKAMLTKCTSISGPVEDNDIFKASDEFLAQSDVANESDRPCRPVYGTSGVKAWIRTNHFLVQLPSKTIFIYRVNIRPVCARGKQTQQLYKLLENHPQYPSNYAATDYAETIVSVRQLNPSAQSTAAGRPEDTLVISVNDNDGHTFVISRVAEILPEELREHLEGRNSGYNPTPALQAIQIILAKRPRNNQDVLHECKKKYFPAGGHPDWIKTVGASLVAVKGFRFSIRSTVGRLLCNINICGTIFYKEGPLTDLMAECLETSDLGRVRDLSLSQIKILRRCLRTIMVRIVGVAVQGNDQDVVRVMGIDTRTPAQVVFKYYDPIQGLAREMNMKEYLFNGIALKSTCNRLILSQFLTLCGFD